MGRAGATGTRRRNRRPPRGDVDAGTTQLIQDKGEMGNSSESFNADSRTSMEAVRGEINDDIRLFRHRFSKQGMSKNIALECVPFSSLLYVSKPLEGSLSRRRSQFFFFLIGCWTTMMAKEEKHEFSAQQFKFIALQTRSGVMCTNDQRPLSHPPELCYRQANDSSFSPAPAPCSADHQPPPPMLAEDFEFGLLLDGQLVAAVPELSFAAALGDFNVDVPFDHAAAWRLILVLKKRG